MEFFFLTESVRFVSVVFNNNYYSNSLVSDANKLREFLLAFRIIREDVFRLSHLFSADCVLSYKAVNCKELVDRGRSCGICEWYLLLN